MSGCPFGSTAITKKQWECCTQHVVRPLIGFQGLCTSYNMTWPCIPGASRCTFVCHIQLILCMIQVQKILIGYHLYISPFVLHMIYDPLSVIGCLKYQNYQLPDVTDSYYISHACHRAGWGMCKSCLEEGKLTRVVENFGHVQSQCQMCDEHPDDFINGSCQPPNIT